MLLLIAAMAASIVRANSFVESPSLKDDIIFVWDDNLVYTQYINRNDLTEEKKNELVAAYQSIVGAIDTSFLSKNVSNYIEQQRAIPSDLVVTDLFDISAIEHKENYTFLIGKEDMNKFFCLIHYNNENWEVVDVKHEEGMLKVTVDSLSPFAFVYNTKEAATTNPINYSTVIFGLIVVAGVVIGTYTIHLHKKRQELERQ